MQERVFDKEVAFLERFEENKFAKVQRLVRCWQRKLKLGTSMKKENEF